MAPDIKQSQWRWPHFSRDELKCKGNGECRMDPAFLDLLERIRGIYGAPLVVTSGYRSPDYNAKVSYTGQEGPHTTGRAVDISIRGSDALKLIKVALACGITGIGVAQKGSARFLHIDNLEAPAYPRPMCWSY